jgi:hypothetical protein
VRGFVCSVTTLQQCQLTARDFKKDKKVRLSILVSPQTIHLPDTMGHFPTLIRYNTTTTVFARPHDYNKPFSTLESNHKMLDNNTSLTSQPLPSIDPNILIGILTLILTFLSLILGYLQLRYRSPSSTLIDDEHTVTPDVARYVPT